MYIKRIIEDKITKLLFKGKVIVIYGPRQVGKTTLVQKLLSNYPTTTHRYFNADEADIQRLFNQADTSTQLKEIIGDATLVVIDEAQRIKNVGLKLKLLVDTFPRQQIIATGSSSFELAQDISEPLTGRSIQFLLHPISLPEFMELVENNPLELKRRLESLLVFGTYPSVLLSPSVLEKKVAINSITAGYLFKDVLSLGGSVRNPEAVRKLTEAVALQIGNEVSYTELASLVGISKETVSAYIDILEKAFIIFRLRPFSRNLRKEIGKLHKIYFYDLGIRNALINNQNPLSLRSDTGGLWENFIISELKKQEYSIADLKKLYFWRTYDGAEIDVVEEKAGELTGFEIKWKKVKKHAPKAWREGYPDAHWYLINQDNFLSFLKQT